MGFKGKVEIADGTDGPADVPVAMLATATSIFTRIVNYYATETERNTETAVPSKMSAAEKLGMRCWVDSRKGYSFWDGTAWKWEPQRNVLFDEPRVIAANATGTSQIDIILHDDLVLPSGNRWVQFRAQGMMANIGGPAGLVQALVSGFATGENIMQEYLEPGELGSFDRTWELVLAGTLSGYHLRGRSTNASVNTSFTYCRYTIVDLGPA